MLKKKINRVGLFVINMFLVCSCSYNNFKDIVGVYKYEGTKSITQLSLYENNGFQLIETNEWGCDTMEGLWGNKGKKLFLKPKIDYNIRICDTCEKNRIIVFNKNDKNPMEYAYIKLFKYKKLVGALLTDDSGMAFFDSNIDSIRVQYIGFKSVGFKYGKNISNTEIYLEYGNDNISEYIHKRNNIIMIINGIKYKMQKNGGNGGGIVR